MTLHLERCRVLFPDWYDDRAELEAECKGWLQGVRVELPDGRRYPVHFYDPVRLGQDLEEDAKWGRACVAEPGMIVVPSVTRAGIGRAVEHLAESGYFQYLQAEGSANGVPAMGLANGAHRNGAPSITGEPVAAP